MSCGVEVTLLNTDDRAWTAQAKQGEKTPSGA